MSKTLAFLMAAMLTAGSITANAQTRRKTENKLSPSASTSMTLGGQAITIEYNAPSARGRQVEGGLIPYGKAWRAGADAATTLTTGADLMIGNLRVPQGVYTLYTFAEPNDWKLIVNKQTGQWGTVYNEAQDLGRVPMKLTPLSAPVEKLEITLKPESSDAGVLQMEWGKTRASVPVRLGK